MRNVPGLETVERDYSPKGVKFYYIYKSLAHPETNGYVAPFSLEERLMHVAEAKKKLGSRFGWLCDSITNDLKHALGDAPNSEFVIDPQGKIVVARRWSRPQELREDLAKFVGEAENLTAIADLNMKRLQPAKTAAKGVVPRLDLPGRMTPVIVKPVSARAKDPFYVKLRVEVEQQLLRSGEGKLYLGFFLDPIYHVHWNNQAAALEYEIKAPPGLTVAPASGKGPQVEQAADADPREFLVELSGDLRANTSRPLQLTVRYFACDDAETFCKPVTQLYEITLTRDRDGGSRRGGGRSGLAARSGFADRGGFDRRRMNRDRFNRGGFGPFGNDPRRRRVDPKAEARHKQLKQAVALFKKYDQDQNGKIDRREWSKADPPIAKADADGDGEISLKEMTNWLKT